MKIKANLHGYIDCLTAILLVTAPWLLSLPPTTATFTSGFAIAQVMLILFTKYKLGLLAFIPMYMRGFIDLFVCFLLVSVGVYLNTIDGIAACKFYLGLSIAAYIIWIFTEYKYLNKG